MTPDAPDEILTTILGEDIVARVDRLARERGLTRGQMLCTLVRSGILACESEEAPPASRRRPKSPAG